MTVGPTSGDLKVDLYTEVVGQCNFLRELSTTGPIRHFDSTQILL